MKKIIAAIIALAAAVSCTQEKPENKHVTLSVEPETVTINAKGDSQTVKVLTNAETWTAQDGQNATWCTLKQESDLLVISAEENTSIEGRTTTVIIRAEEKEATIEVKQEGASTILSVSQDVAELNADGTGKVSIEVTSNVEWTAVLDDETYFKIELTESGFDISALSANNTTKVREANVTVSSESVETTLNITVRQAAGTELYHILTSTLNFSEGRVLSLKNEKGEILAKICREYIRESSTVFGQKTVLYLAPDGELDMKHGIELESGRTITWDPASAGEIISFSDGEGVTALSEFWIDNSGKLVTELDNEEGLAPKFVTDRLVDDRDGEVYGIVKIGVHWWMTENLRTVKYLNGDPITAATPSKAWGDTGTYGYDADAPKKCGYYYNGLAVNDERGLAPEGWMIPDNDTWTLLTTKYTRKGSARYKSTDPESGWTKNPEKPANDPTNDTGFSAYVTYYINATNGEIADTSIETWFWSATSIHDALTKDNVNIYVRITNSGANLVYDPSPSMALGHNPAQFAHNVRCAKKCFDF